MSVKEMLESVVALGQVCSEMEHLPFFSSFEKMYGALHLTKEHNKQRTITLTNKIFLELKEYMLKAKIISDTDVNFIQKVLSKETGYELLKTNNEKIVFFDDKIYFELNLMDIIKVTFLYGQKHPNEIKITVVYFIDYLIDQEKLYKVDKLRDTFVLLKKKIKSYFFDKTWSEHFSKSFRLLYPKDPIKSAIKKKLNDTLTEFILVYDTFYDIRDLNYKNITKNRQYLKKLEKVIDIKELDELLTSVGKSWDNVLSKAPVSANYSPTTIRGKLSDVYEQLNTVHKCKVDYYFLKDVQLYKIKAESNSFNIYSTEKEIWEYLLRKMLDNIKNAENEYKLSIKELESQVNDYENFVSGYKTYVKSILMNFYSDLQVSGKN